MGIMRRISLTIVMALGLGFSGTAVLGDTLLVESVESGASVARPAHGATMESVLQHHGEPGSRSGPVGDPPISTWDYGEFVVYFEGQHVIHSVVPPRR
jgi:hypothetical protein